MPKKHIAVDSSSSGSFGDILRYNDSQGIFYYTPLTGALGSDVLLSSTSLALDVITDQVISLSGGTRYLITAAVIYDPSVYPVSGISDGQIWSGASRTGQQYFSTSDPTSGPPPTELFDLLISAQNYINLLVPICFPPPCSNLVLVPHNQLYFTLTSASAVPLTCKLNLYGRVIDP